MQARHRHPVQADPRQPLRLNALDWLLYTIGIVCLIGAGVLVLAVWTGLEVVRGQRSPWIGFACAAVFLAGLLIWLGLSLTTP